MVATYVAEEGKWHEYKTLLPTLIHLYMSCIVVLCALKLFTSKYVTKPITVLYSYPPIRLFIDTKAQ